MAINPRKYINTIEDNSNIFIGITNKFNNKKKIFNNTKTTQENVKYKIINYLLTSPTERIHNYNFLGLYDFLFEQISNDNIEFLEQELSEKIKNVFPFIKINNVNVRGVPQNNTINIKLNYGIINSNIEDNIDIDIN